MHSREKLQTVSDNSELDVGCCTAQGFYHRVEPVAVIKLNCLNKAFERQAAEWQKERLTHFKDQKKGGRNRNGEGCLPHLLLTASGKRSNSYK